MEELTKKEQKIISQIQNIISSCGNCESWDNETKEPFWIWGEGTDMYDLLDEYNIEYDRKEIVAFELRCCCGSELELTSKVGIKRKYEIELEAYIENVTKKFSKPLQSFDELINNHPLLALKHPIGKKIYSEISKKNLPECKIIEGDILYRARLSSNSILLDSEDFKRAPLGIPTEGRFNHSGQSHWYLCSNEECAILEIVDQGLVWTQQFETKGTIDKILDLSFDYNDISTSMNTLLASLHFSDVLLKNKKNNENWKPDYFATRYIMDCAKSCGYNGIKYNSTKNFSAINYVLFYPDSIEIDTVGRPKINMHSRQEDDFLDF